MQKFYQPLQFYRMPDSELKKTYGLVESPLNKKLIARFEQRGADVLIFPAVKAERLELPEAQKNILKNPARFDWIILTDVLAADFFIEILRELDIDFFELDNSTICAAGEAVADRLRFVQVHSDVIPSKISDEAIFSAISDFAGKQLKDLRFLIVCGNYYGSALKEKLNGENALVEELKIYKAGLGDESANAKLKTLLKGGAVDEFIFSSPEDLLSLKILFSGEKTTEILMETRVSAVSEVVFQTLQEAGLRPLYFHDR